MDRRVVSLVRDVATVAASVLGPLIAVSAVPAASVTEYLVSPTETHYPQNTQNESPMAVNPVDPLNVITGANDEHAEPDCVPLTGGSSTCPRDPNTSLTGVYATTDGGATWTRQLLSWITSGLVASGDPVVTFGPKPDGAGGFSYAQGARAYFGSLARPVGGGAHEMLIAVSYSDNQGVTWSPPVVATTRDNPVDANDRLEVRADANPTSPHFGNLYVSWTLFKGVSHAAEPIMVSRSTDGGQSFSAPRALTQSSNSAAAGGRQASQIRTAPDGSVFVVWDGTLFRTSAVLAARSMDGGVSFGRPFLVSYKSDVPSPFPGTSFRVNSGPMIDIDTNDAIYVAWANYTGGHSVVRLAKSTDGGATWSVTTAADVDGRSAFYPAVAVSGSTVFIGFNAIDDQLAGTPAGAGVALYDAYYVLSGDGGVSFDPPVKISAESSDPDSTTRHDLIHQFIGDYNGAAASTDGSFWFAWTDTRHGLPCPALDAWRSSPLTTRPNIYDSCPASFGNSDIFVGHIVP